MKTLFALFIFFAHLAWAQSSEFPIPRLQGLYSYQENFHIPNIRRAETVVFQTPEGQQRVKELRSQGYSCIRNSTQTRLCTKNWKPEQNPEGIENSVRKFMKGVEVQFEGSSSEPVLIHDGSTTQEWNVYENVRIMETQVSLYRVVRNHNGKIYIAFPVNENQPMSPLNYVSDSKLGLMIIGNVKDTPNSTTAYSIEAFLEKP